MDVINAILKRRSIRAFDKKQISNESVKNLLEAARWAPSGGNRQFWRFIEIRDQRRLSMIKVFSAGLKGDPTLIIAIGADIKEQLNLLDLGMAAENIMLEAVEMGLGSCAIASFSEEPMKQLLNMPKEMRIILLISIGYPAEYPKPRPKKTLQEIAFSEKFGGELRI